MSFAKVLDFIETMKNYGLEKAIRRYYSFYAGVVVDNEDPEGLGRVKVKCPGISEDPIVPFAMPCFQNAGPSRGFFQPPEVGDNVWVTFQQGSLRFPIYMGGWYGNPKEGSEVPLGLQSQGNPKIRGYTSKFGHAVLFDETEGKEKITIRAPQTANDKSKFNQIIMDCTGGKQQIIMQSAQGHLFVLDDTDGKESIFVIHKDGSQLQFDPKGSFKVFAGGAAFSMDAETGTTSMASKFGALMAVDKTVLLADASGKSLVTMTDSAIQVTTAGDAVVQANTMTANVGAFTVDTKLAKISMGNGKLSMGTPAAEVVKLMGMTLDAALNDPAPATCGVGPVSPLSGLMRAQFTIIKALIATIQM